jgi:hypothetical protein
MDFYSLCDGADLFMIYNTFITIRFLPAEVWDFGL